MPNQLFDSGKNISDIGSDQLSEMLCIDRSCIFIVVNDRHFNCDEVLVSKIRTILHEFNLVVDKELNLSRNGTGLGGAHNSRIFAVQSKAIERCRDALKKIFFEVYLQIGSPAKSFALSDYLMFVCPPKKTQGEIVEHTFVHGIGRFYRFLYNARKHFNGVGDLHQYLGSLPQNCPNHLFLSGPKVSKGNWAFPVIRCSVPNSDLIKLATKASGEKLMKRAHENIEKYLILNDPKTFACEIPIWLQPSDFQDYETRFKTTSCITGHIDILRIESNGKLGLWDYKPNADKEKTAAQQVWFYMMMLSKRTGVPIEQIEGGYFDESSAFSVLQNP
jgi:hypothetical protein